MWTMCDERQVGVVHSLGLQHKRHNRASALSVIGVLGALACLLVVPLRSVAPWFASEMS